MDKSSAMVSLKRAVVGVVGLLLVGCSGAIAQSGPAPLTDEQLAAKVDGLLRQMTLEEGRSARRRRRRRRAGAHSPQREATR
jgi:hypothetical protein